MTIVFYSIGLAIARRFAQDGAMVMVSSRSRENVEKAVEELTAEKLTVAGTVCHVGKPEDRAKLIQKTISLFGGIDILVSNAAANPKSAIGPILDCSESEWEKIFDTNVKAAFCLCKEVVPYMQKRGGGSVVFVSSYAAYIPATFQSTGPYSVSKTALVGLTKALVPQLAAMNIRVNCIAPGLIKTNFSRRFWETEEMRKASLDRIPIRRLGEAHDVAGVASFLVSDEASYITGESIVVAGGAPSRL